METIKGFHYIPDFLTVQEQDILMKNIASLEYTHDKFRGQVMKRGYAQFGYAYVSNGRKIETAPALPEYLSRLIDKAIPYCPQSVKFDQCIVTHYPVGSGIGWHTDAPKFQDCIIAVSLGSECKFQFRKDNEERIACETSLRPGSLYIMEGDARWKYQHHMPSAKAERYSITFRQVV